MIRLLLMLLLCLSSPVFAQEEKKQSVESAASATASAKETQDSAESSPSDVKAKGNDSEDARKEKETKKKPLNTSMVAGALKFRSVGPAFMSGRIGDIAIDQKNPNTWYVAVASGGVWKTTNAGTTFKPIFDNQKSYSIGCVSIDPSVSSTVWVGTGENNGGRHIGFGDGVYVSHDSGNTWRPKASKNPNTSARFWSIHAIQMLCCCVSGSSLVAWRTTRTLSQRQWRE